MKTVLAVAAFGLVFVSSAHAQSDPKREACLKEAEAKGLYISGTRNPGRFNEGTAPQRQAFMKECMARR